MSRAIARVAQGLLIVLLGAAPLLLLEGGLRLAGWPTERVRTFGKLLTFDQSEWERSLGVFRPGARATVLWPPELSYEVHVNGLGFRGPEIAPTPPPGVTRILALGDSHTFGFYLAEDETWPARLEALLRDAGVEAEVVNAGCGSWSIDSETLFTLERGLEVRPDHVLLAFFGNDLDDLRREEPVYVSQQRALLGWRAALTRAVYTSASYELYLRAQVAWKGSRREAPPTRTARTPPPDVTSASAPDDEALWKSYAGWLARLQAGLAERNVPLSIVYVPSAAEILGDTRNPYEDRLRALAKERGIPFASPTAGFRAHRDDPALFWLPYDPHLGIAGARLVAEAAAGMLLPDAVAD